MRLQRLDLSLVDLQKWMLRHRCPLTSYREDTAGLGSCGWAPHVLRGTCPPQARRSSGPSPVGETHLPMRSCDRGTPRSPGTLFPCPCPPALWRRPLVRGM